MLEKLSTINRILIEAPLQPVQGDRFQPTGFPDIGAGLYTLPDGTRKILLESAQSMANRLEQTIIGPDNELIEDFKGLSYVAANLIASGMLPGSRTNSLIEAHRMNSPFIISDSEFKERFTKDAGYAKGQFLDWRKIGKALFKYDVNSILHGAFFANIDDGRIKVSRAITGFIEACDVKEVVTGGVKNNAMDPTGTIRAQAYADKDVYGNVPYHRVEYTAESITAFFNFDLGLVRSYALGEQAESLLINLGLFKIRRFLDGGLRLRTACDLKLKNDGSIIASLPSGFEIPDFETLKCQLQESIAACREMFAYPPVTEINTAILQKEKSEKAKSGTEEEQV